MSHIVKITHENETLELEIGNEEFTFIEFDHWLRARLPVKRDDKLRFLNKNGQEILPGKGLLKVTDEISVEKVPVVKPSVSMKESKVAASSNRNTNVFIDNISAQYSVAAMLFILTIMIFVNEPLVEIINDYMVAYKWICHDNMKVISETFAAFFAWSTTYLLIRRSMNPETASVALQKFSFDAFYGGLAASASVLLKYFIMYKFDGR